jgi:hypothetical protein
MPILQTTALALSLLASSPAPTPPSLSSLSWLAGDWRGAEEGTESQEVWTEPAGDSMVGVWRLVVNGKLKVTEHLTIVQEGAELVMHLRHFDRSGAGWEEKDAPIVLPLVRAGDGEAVFEARSGAKGPLRIAYARKADGTLVTEIAHGEHNKSTYTFRRAGPPERP